ncbi:MAG: hypothetical protein ABI777_11180 [Betaproteobacteria bacterium]
MKRMIMVAATAVAASAALMSANASAQISDDWKFQGTIYGYFPDISGKTKFPAGGTDVDVSIDKILGNLKFVMMGTLAAQKGRWGVFTDVIYMDVGGTKSDIRDFTVGGHPLPADAVGTANLDIKSLVWTLGGSYRAVADPGLTLDVLAGARLLDVKMNLDWQFTGNVESIPVGARGGTREVSNQLWDGVVGVKGKVAFGADRRWFAPYYFDVGTGNSEFTWQAMAGLGYSYQWGDVFAAWRYLDYKMKSGSPIEDLNLNGPMLAASFRW